MRLTFTKRGGEYDDLTVERDRKPAEVIACPKQGIIPHDMVHYAVESVITERGFLSLVAVNGATGFQVSGHAASEAVERLVETLQAEMWGERVQTEDLLAVYEHACDARGHAVAPVSPDDVALMRARIAALEARWAALSVGDSLTLEF